MGFHFLFYILIFIYFFKYETIVSRNGLSLWCSEPHTSSVIIVLVRIFMNKSLQPAATIFKKKMKLFRKLIKWRFTNMLPYIEPDWNNFTCYSQPQLFPLNKMSRQGENNHSSISVVNPILALFPWWIYKLLEFPHSSNFFLQFFKLLTLFLQDLVTWRSYKGWFRPHLVGIGLT